MSDLEFERFLPAEPGVVFRHLTEPELLTTWWPSGAEVDLELGGKYHFWWDGPGWHLRGEYREIDPADRLSFTWSWDHDDIEAREVKITFEPRDGGTTIHLHHEAGSSEEMEGYEAGWTHFMGLLAEKLAPAGDEAP